MNDSDVTGGFYDKRLMSAHGKLVKQTVMIGNELK